MARTSISISAISSYPAGSRSPRRGWPSRRMAFSTSSKSNAILFPHMWSGTSKAMEAFIGPGRPLDPLKYFIILPGQFGNGFSFVAEQYTTAVQPGRLPPRDDRGRRAGAASLGDRAFRHQGVAAGAWLVYGRPADLRVGCAFPRYGEPCASVCGICPYDATQFPLSPTTRGHIKIGSQLERRFLSTRINGGRPAPPCTALVGHGPQPALLRT